ncbi:hypothetical protein LINGRAHAP2_LOCUS22785 [Linum grandiflorum]
MTYVTRDWLPCSMKWAHCYTNKVFHIGNTSNNRVESQHSSFKKWLNTFTSHVDTLFEAYHCSMEGQIIEVQRDLGESHAKVYNYAHIPLIAFVNNVISLWVIELIHEQVNKPTHCDCVISLTHGIPCNCVLQGMEENGDDLMSYHVHGFWCSMEYRKPPEVDKWEDYDAADRSILQGMVQNVCDKGGPKCPGFE